MRPKQDCRTGKRRFANRVEAELAADTIGLPHVHKCTHCKGWHLTNQNPVGRTVNGLTRTQKRREVRKRAKERKKNGEI